MYFLSSSRFPLSFLYKNMSNLNFDLDVQMGAYHTLDLEVNRKFTITKTWDSVDLERVENACDPAQVKTESFICPACRVLH